MRGMFTVVSLLLTLAGSARAGSEDEVRALFAKFVAAQNAHDIKAVSELLQDSPNFLWITRALLSGGVTPPSSGLKPYIKAHGLSIPSPMNSELPNCSPTFSNCMYPYVHDRPGWPNCAADTFLIEPSGG